MKKINYLIWLFLLLVKNLVKSDSKHLLNIINGNSEEIKKINRTLSSFTTKNNLFNETKKIIKNISHYNELFENEYNYIKSNNKIKLKEESLYQRLIPETLFEYDKTISCFNLISVKAMAKDDTGNFVYSLLLTCQNNSIIISDLLGNIYSIYNTNNTINKIVTFKENDMNFFYVLSNNFTKLTKFILSYNIYSNNSTIKDNLSDTIEVEAYSEDEKRENIENFSYKLFDIYKQNINSKKLQIYEENHINFILDKNDEYIININPITIKGTNYLMVITNKYSVYKLNYKNLDIIYYAELGLNYMNNISSNLLPISLNFFYILFNKSEKGYSIFKYDNTTSILGECDLFFNNNTETVKNYFFEEKSKTIYILSSLNKIYLSIPILISPSESMNKNFCKKIFLCELNKITDAQYNNYFDIILLNKKLMFTKDGINFEVVDITKVGNVDEKNKLQTKYFDLSKHITEKNNFPSLIMKDNKKYLFLKQIRDKALILFVLYEKNAKIYTSEAPTFNFKVPIILVAFAIILIWNYIKGKREGSEIDINKFKSKYQ